MTTLAQIGGFLARKRLAVVGVSRNPKDFTRMLFREFLKQGYDVVPVNPALGEADGVKCYAAVAEIPPPIEAALLLTKPAVTEQVVEECARAGIRNVWLHRATGAGAVSPRALDLCSENSIEVVAGECPFMFLPHPAWIHRAHRFCRKTFGSYPQ